MQDLVSATIGTALAFIVARYITRDRLQKMIDDAPKFAA